MMVAALDVYYKDDRAKAVALLFSWADEKGLTPFVHFLDHIEPYVPGEFYKRELPCLLAVIGQLDLDNIDALIIDGHVYVDDSYTHGLGGRLWQALEEKIPIIGVAKTSFRNNAATVVEVYRGGSHRPLFVSAIGMDGQLAADRVENMAGEYRIPEVLKELDRVTRMF